MDKEPHARERLKTTPTPELFEAAINLQREINQLAAALTPLITSFNAVSAEMSARNQLFPDTLDFDAEAYVQRFRPMEMGPHSNN